MRYLDHAGLGIPYIDILQQEYQYKIAMANDPSREFVYIDTVEKEKETVCKGMFHCNNYNLSYIRNTTEGTTIAANVIDLKEDDEVVISSLEHRSSENCWRYICEKKKAKVINVDISYTDNTEDIFIKFSNVINKKTKVVFFSHVDRNFGITFPVTKIASIAEKYGALTVVDGAQALGLIDVNLDILSCSIYICSFHKWCRMPSALGAILVRKDVATKLGRLFLGDKRLEEKAVSIREFGSSELGTRNVALEMCVPLLIKRMYLINECNVFKYFKKKLSEAKDKIKIVSYIHCNDKGFFVCSSSKFKNELQDVLLRNYGIMVGRVKKNNSYYLRISFDHNTSFADIDYIIDTLTSL